MKVPTRARRLAWIRFAALLHGVLLPLAMPVLADQDLGEVYQGDLDHYEDAGPVDWSVDFEDVWKLSFFRFELAGKLELNLGPTTAVFGRHGTEETGYSVVWAALFPEEPAELMVSQAGNGDEIRTVFIRFNPALLTDLFPAATVEGQGDPSWLVWAWRQYGNKSSAYWQVDWMPMVPPRNAISIDIDTADGKRRLYALDTNLEKIHYVESYADHGLTPVPDDGLDRVRAVDIFRQAWYVFDEIYPLFTIKQRVSWEVLYERYEPLAERAKSSYELAGVIALLVNHLEDTNLSIWAGEGPVPSYRRVLPGNSNWKAIEDSLSDLQRGKGLAWARTGNGLGYINVASLVTEDVDVDLDEALEALSDTVGLIVDLRSNAGGDEDAARRMAGRFLDEQRVYGLRRYRSGPEHDELGSMMKRTIRPRGPWRYEAPVVVLQGRETISTGASLALMLAQCPDVTTMGDRTGGTSADSRWVKLSRGIQVYVPRSLEMDPEGNPIAVTGVSPMLPIVVAGEASLWESDPVFEAAVEFLEKKRLEREPGKEK